MQRYNLQFWPIALSFVEGPRRMGKVVVMTVPGETLVWLQFARLSDRLAPAW